MKNKNIQPKKKPAVKEDPSRMISLMGRSKYNKMVQDKMQNERMKSM